MSQIKSKQRVADHGEVFTAEREVNAMLDLVKSETDRIESRFLEPACGDGNFLVEILRRKLVAAKAASKYKGKVFPEDFEKKAITAICSIYGVELLQDNVDACIERLYALWNKEYTKVCKKAASDQCREIARYILRHNILCGDTLTMLKADGTPIIFAQWDFVPTDCIKRRDYRLDELMRDDHDENGGPPERQTSFFDDESTPESEWEFDTAANAWMPKPIKEYPPIFYRRIMEYD